MSKPKADQEPTPIPTLQDAVGSLLAQWDQGNIDVPDSPDFLLTAYLRQALVTFDRDQRRYVWSLSAIWWTGLQRTT